MKKTEIFSRITGLHAIYNDNANSILKTLNLHFDDMTVVEANDFYSCLQTIVSQDNMDYIIRGFDHRRLFAVVRFYVQNKELRARDIQSIETDFQRIELIGEYYPHYLLQKLFFKDKTPWLFVQLFFEFSDFDYNLFIHYLKEKRIRNFPGLSLTITKREEQLFLFFPKDRIIYGSGRFLTIYLLFVKVSNILENDELEDLFYSSELFSFDNVERIILNWDKWRSVFLFFNRNADELTRTQTHSIIDFLVETMIRRDEGAVLNFKKIKPTRLNQYIEEWHLELYLKKLEKNTTWSSVEPFPGKYIDRQDEYEILEITDAVDLFAEGKALHHCVRTYLEGCIKGLYSIWSLRRVVSKDKFIRLLTIQVREGMIIQAKGFKNRSVYCDEARILELWAKDNNLRFGLVDIAEDLPI